MNRLSAAQTHDEVVTVMTGDGYTWLDKRKAESSPSNSEIQVDSSASQPVSGVPYNKSFQHLSEIDAGGPTSKD